MFIAVVVYIAPGGGLRVVCQRLLRLRADRDFVLWGSGLGCCLRWSFKCCRRWLRLRQCIDCVNRLNGNGHGYHLTRLTSARGELTLALQ